MTDYRVDWPPRIRDQVLRFMILAAAGTGREMAALNRALTEIEEVLQRSPTVAGESRVGELRILAVAPISVIYRVDQDAREVLVRSIRYSPGKRR